MTDWFEYAQPVRYFEIDGQGVVFNAWYLAYMDEAINAYLGHRGVDYATLVASGYDLQLVHTELDWTTSLRYGDVGAVAVRTEALGTTSLTIGFEIRRGEGGPAVCTARSVYVCISVGGGKVPLPDLLRTNLS
ncbi:acyl-CoA thioesterase [Spongisporangium articulatum]|uniref:Acyl-CoA thioesterase n=1 Tax=Spongisporangium articulatum TaxID=3362603 RepID=A0ABW8AU44_9ACTN